MDAYLTAREVQVVRLVAQGLTNEQIADRLYLSPDTIKTHLRRVFRRLDVNNRAELVARSIALDLA